MKELPLNKIICGEALKELKKLPDESIDMVMTSPPYWALRDYGVSGQLGLEPTPEHYIENLCDIFHEVKRVLKKTGTCFVNIGDTYYGGGRNRGNKNPKVKTKTVRGLINLGDTLPGPKGTAKSLAQIPSRFAIAMADRGWILRNEIIWQKPNCMPSSATDRFTVDFEKVYFFTKNKKYWFNSESVKEVATGYDGRKDTMYHGGKKDMAGGKHERWKKRKNAGTDYGGNGKGLQNHSGYSNIENPYVRNKRCVWPINTKPFIGAHFAVFPEELCETPIKAGSPERGVVLDPFFGAGTTGLVALKLGRKFIGIDLNPEYCKIAEDRLKPFRNSLFN